MIVLKYNISVRKGSQSQGFYEETIPYLGAFSFGAAKNNLDDLAELFERDNRCVVDRYSNSAFIVWWTEDGYIDEDTERYIYAIGAEEINIDL